jgi:hypothetical protein
MPTSQDPRLLPYWSTPTVLETIAAKGKGTAAAPPNAWGAHARHALRQRAQMNDRKATAAKADEYEQLIAEAYEYTLASSTKLAMMRAKKAIALEPERAEAHAVLAAAYCTAGDWLCASNSNLAAMQRHPPGSKAWGQFVAQAWACRCVGATCGSHDMFCGCESCAALPERVVWMRSRQSLAAMAVRAVTAAPDDVQAWRMHARVHKETGDMQTAAQGYVRAAKLSGEKGDVELREDCYRHAHACLEAARRSPPPACGANEMSMQMTSIMRPASPPQKLT